MTLRSCQGVVGGAVQRVARTLRLRGGILVLGAMALSACAPARSYLKPSEVQKLSRQSGWKHRIEVFPDADHVVVFPSADRRVRVSDDAEYVDRARNEVYVLRVRKDYPGRIIGTGRENGKAWLWVSYSPECKRRSCAFGYVESEQGRFSLAQLPKAQGYLPATVYRGELEEESRMELSRLLSFDEPHQIWYWQGDGQITSVDLQVDRVPHPEPRAEASR